MTVGPGRQILAPTQSVQWFGRLFLSLPQAVAPPGVPGRVLAASPPGRRSGSSVPTDNTKVYSQLSSTYLVRADPQICRAFDLNSR
jgi:hypothetical protein